MTIEDKYKKAKPDFRGKCTMCEKNTFLIDRRCVRCIGFSGLTHKADRERIEGDIIRDIHSSMSGDYSGVYVDSENSYDEIVKLHIWLTEFAIPHTFEAMFDGYQICYPSKGENRVVSVIEHYGSYGSEEDRLEIMGLLTPQELEHDSVLGYLTARDVFARIKKHLSENPCG